MSRSGKCLFLIYFCIQTLCPQIAIADDGGTGTGAIVSEPGPVMETGSVLSSNGASSGLSEETSESDVSTSSPVPSVAISEVMWMGSDISTADEWVEISAIGDGSQSLSGWTLLVLKGTAESVITKFPATLTIQSGQSLVISNYAKDASRLAIDPALTSTAMSLPNTKLLLRLRDAQGNLIDEIDDGIGNPFAGSNPAGGGPKASMERIDLGLPGNDPTNWKTAMDSRGFDPGLPIFGTPGYFTSITTQQSSVLSSQSSSIASSVTSAGSSESFVSSASSKYDQINSSSIQLEPSIGPIINEVLPDPKGSDDAEWIEIFNPAPLPLNLSGMIIRVGTSGHRIKGTASGLIITPNAVVLIPKSIVGFTLTNAGATVRLESGSTIIDTFKYPATPEGISVGRLGSEIIPFCLPSPGRPNASLPVDASLVVQSGKLSGVQPVSVNLGITAVSGSLAGAACHTDYGDGHTSDSCNPSTHSMQVIGDYTITSVVHDYCSNTVIQTLTGSVIHKPFYYNAKVTQTKQLARVSCTPDAFTGVTISEILPNPKGDEGAGEWMEVRSTNDEQTRLCGWSVDDGPGGSKPASLSSFVIEPHGYLVLPRTDTKVALNNDHDTATLIAPLPEGGTGVAMTVLFDAAPAEQSYAIRTDGKWSWTPYLTPGAENKFQDPASSYLPSPISIVAALPNPKGVDTFDEYIELKNSALWPIWLNGWSIRNANGKELDLTGIVLAKAETKRIKLARLSYTLGNTSDTLSLLDENHIVRSVLSWTNAGSNEIERPFVAQSGTGVLVRQVIDGDTIVVQMTASGSDYLEKVRLLGIDAPELHSDTPAIVTEGFLSKNFLSALLINKKVDLQFDTDRRDKYGRLLAYVFLEGRDIQQELLTQGLAYAYRVFPIGRLEEYKTYESMARTMQSGIWSMEDLTHIYDAKIADQDAWRAAHTHGLTLKADVPEGVTSSGNIVHMKASQSAQLYVSINRSPYMLFSGSILLASNQTIRAYAEMAYDGAKVQSPVLEKTYVVDAAVTTGAVRISEVYPSPKKGETEWIELQNISAQDVSMAGWLLDDAEKGSKPYRITADVLIPAKGFLLFPKTLTNLSLNNDGDDVRLFSPTGDVMDALTYPSIKTGRSYAWDDTTKTYCLTDTSTPLKLNTCFIQNKKSTQKKSIKKGTKLKSVKSKKVPILADESKGNGSGLYVDLKQQVLGLHRQEMVENSQSGLWQGMGIGLFLGITLLLGWIFKEKYSLFK